MDKERIDGFRSAFALEFMRFLQGQGIRVPEDVQIIGFDDTLASRESVPALTTIHQDAALRARTAIRRLEALRDGTPCDAGILIAQFLGAEEHTVAFSYLPMAVSTVLSAWLRCHRHAGFPAFEPAFDLDRLCGLPSKGSGTPAHRGDLDTVGGRFMFIFRVQRRA